MKSIVIIPLFILLIFYGSSFTVKDKDVVLDNIHLQYSQQLDFFQNTLNAYKKATQQNNLQILQAAHLQSRLAFKRIEVLLHQLTPTAVKKQLNGAPLPWVKFWGGQKKIIEPIGLQVLDELVFSEINAEQKQKIEQLVHQLNIDFQNIKKSQSKAALFHQGIFEAARMELVRIFTLGLTGFDTPGSLNALPEAVAALESTAQLMQHYIALLPEKDSLRQDLESLFSEAIQTLNTQNDFDDFDRLAFLKNYLNPLYGSLYDLHYRLGTAYFDDPLWEMKAVNYQAKNLFDTNFLRAGFYLKSDLNNDLGELRIMLGERLFFDQQLSHHDKISCATCHQPRLAFTDGLSKSLSNNGQMTVRRNAPTLINTVYASRYFHDLRERHLPNQIRHVVEDSLEFATNFQSILKKITKNSTYIEQFKAAFQLPNTDVLASYHINVAIATYIASLTAMNSPFDQYIRQESETLNPAAQRGFNLFMGKAACGTCHFAPTFSGTVPPFYTDTEAEVLGVPATKDTLYPTLDKDLGRYDSGFPIDKVFFNKQAFKTPTIRNIAETAPYMHNGVYDTLEEVMDFYNRGGGAGLGLDLPHQTLATTPLNLTKIEQADIIAFMKSLSDNPFSH